MASAGSDPSMAKDALTAGSESFRLTIVRPEAEAGVPHALHGTVKLTPGGPAASCRVALALFARYTQRIGASGIAGEASIAGSSTTVTRADGPVPFELALPSSVARAYAGAHLHIEPGILATSDDGTALRVVMPADWELPSDATLFVRGLPVVQSAGAPISFLFSVARFVLGVGLVVAGAIVDVALMYQGGAALVISGVVLGLVKRRGVLGWLRVGAARATLAPREQGLRVRVEAGARAVGGRASVCANEYEIDEGHETDLAEVIRTAAPLARLDDGALEGVVPLPGASQAPPTLALRSLGRTVGIRWSVLVELDTRSGSVARFVLPFTMGVRGAAPA